MDDENPGAPSTGRPTDYTPDLAKVVCDRLASGESLRAICADDDMPGKTTVFSWLASNAEFRDQYAIAREAQAEFFADEIIEIADDTTGDFITKNTDNGPIEVVDHEHIARSRLRVDARKWFASKVAPKKYGDRQTLEHTGKDGKDLPAPAAATVMIVQLPDNGRG